MDSTKLDNRALDAFGVWPKGEGKSCGTQEKYLRDVRAFARWLGKGEPSQETAAAWKEHLLQENYAPVTVNSMLGALNCFFRFAV